jgi:hypothetical protein
MHACRIQWRHDIRVADNPKWVNYRVTLSITDDDKVSYEDPFSQRELNFMLIAMSVSLLSNVGSKSAT